ncbi:MAG: TraB/GumN family protein [Chthoniobacterales bacterium]
MFGRRVFLFCLIALSAIGAATESRAATACVWKVTAPDGKIAYLGGSVHALQKNDYPLPAAYTRAFDASSRMALEVDAKALTEASKALEKEGNYRHGDSLKNHVDPRTYAYMRKLFGLMGVPEETLRQCRPWYIVYMLQTISTHHSLPEVGVDEFFMKRAAKRKTPIVGLESFEEHARVYSGLTDRESEILLLVTFIPSSDTGGKDDIMKAWRRGDADALAAIMQRESAEFPAFNDRLLGARNRAWVPKIENFLESGQTYFVLVGAGHFGGSNGLLALLRAKGYQIEQL